MREPKESFTILMADDDEDDFFLVREAFRESGFREPLIYVPDGQELMDYLYRRGKYSDPAQSPRPDLILLDLNMPVKSGREALREIKSDLHLETIPIVIITTSEDERDKLLGAQFGVCSFVTKPNSFGELVAVIKANAAAWLNNRQKHTE